MLVTRSWESAAAHLPIKSPKEGAMKLANIDWSRLHDATLIAVSAEWQSGEARVRVRLGQARDQSAEIVVAGVRLLRWSREQPWGPSVSINEVRFQRVGEDRIRIELEVQSGDVVELEGDQVDLRLGV